MKCWDYKAIWFWGSIQPKWSQETEECRPLAGSFGPRGGRWAVGGGSIPLSGVFISVAEDDDKRLVITGSGRLERLTVETDLLSTSTTNGDKDAW